MGYSMLVLIELNIKQFLLRLFRRISLVTNAAHFSSYKRGDKSYPCDDFTESIGIPDSVAFLIAATHYQGNRDGNHKLWNIDQLSYILPTFRLDLKYAVGTIMYASELHHILTWVIQCWF
jgi:hypothetical protein